MNKGFTAPYLAVLTALSVRHWAVLKTGHLDICPRSLAMPWACLGCTGLQDSWGLKRSLEVSSASLSWNQGHWQWSMPIQALCIRQSLMLEKTFEIIWSSHQGWYLQGWSLHNCAGESGPGFDHPQSKKKCLLRLKWNFPYFSLCLLPLILPILSALRGVWLHFLYVPQHQVFVHLNKIPLSFLLLRLANLSSLGRINLN